MALDYAKFLGVISKVLPSKKNDGDSKEIRLDRFGNVGTRHYGRSGVNGDCSEGALYTFHHSAMTAITGQATGVVASLYTLPFFCLRNGTTSASDKRITPHWVEVTMASAGSGTLAQHWAAEMDNGGSSRVTAGGTALTGVNTNMQDTGTSVATITAGALTAAGGATVRQRKLGQGVIREVIPVIGDKYMFVFGDNVAVPPTPTAQTVGVIINSVIALPACELGYQDELFLHLFGPSTANAATFYIRGQYSER